MSKREWWLSGLLCGLALCVPGCSWLADHKPTEAEKAKAAAIARCVATAVHDSAAGAGGQP